MKRRLPFHSNAVWPPLGLVVVFALTYAMLDGGILLIEHSAPKLRGEISSLPEIVNIRSGILTTAAALYALYRLWRFHPACHPAYAAWLNTSPWTPAKPLPLGPVQLVWQDAVVVGTLAALAQWHAHLSATLPLMAFGLAYLVGMTLLLAFTRTWTACLLLGFLWPAPSLPPLRGAPMLAILAAMLIVIGYGYRKSLRALPWRRDASDNGDPARYDRAKSILEFQICIDVSTRNPGASVSNLGWPFQHLSPNAGSPPVAKSTSLALGALFGWWTCCAIVGGEIPSATASVLIFLVGALLALFRFAIYCSGVGPPYNLWGRLSSGRLIVPGFDQVLATPLLVFVLGAVGGVLLRHAGSWYPAAAAGLMSLLWIALLTGGPTLRKWLLTGQHRYRAPGRLGGNRLLRPI